MVNAQSPEPSPAGASDTAVSLAASVRAWQRQIVAALVAQAGSVLTMGFIVMLGHADLGLVAVWAPLSMAASTASLIALRQGWTLHLPDPALTAPQIVWSIGSAMCCYAMAGPLRSVVLPMICLTLIFSIFALPARTVRTITLGTLAAFAMVMTTMAWWQPQRYPPLDELALFVTLALALPPMALLAGRMSELRTRLGRQRHELAAALERNQALAAQDDLTGLSNRRHMQIALQRAQDASKRMRPFAVALVDLDHFKLVNDRHGHAVGDEMLRRFARVAVSALRGSDTVGRWGGEEFIVLLDDTEPADAHSAVDRLRQHVAQDRVTLPDGSQTQVTVSAGLARHRHGETVDATIARADKLLYQAKAAGRNRVHGEPVETAETMALAGAVCRAAWVKAGGSVDTGE